MNGTNYKLPDCGAFFTPHFHPSWAQIFASGTGFQIGLHTEINFLFYLDKNILSYVIRVLVWRQDMRIDRQVFIPIPQVELVPLPESKQSK